MYASTPRAMVIGAVNDSAVWQARDISARTYLPHSGILH